MAARLQLLHTGLNRAICKLSTQTHATSAYQSGKCALELDNYSPLLWHQNVYNISQWLKKCQRLERMLIWKQNLTTEIYLFLPVRSYKQKHRSNLSISRSFIFNFYGFSFVIHVLINYLVAIAILSNIIKSPSPKNGICRSHTYLEVLTNSS